MERQHVLAVDVSSSADESLAIELSKEQAVIDETHVSSDARSTLSGQSEGGRSVNVPLKMKIVAVLLVTLIGFGSHWSSGVTGAMKSTLKKELKINNTQYALLEASQDFMVTALILITGLATDRIGGAGAMVWGNVIYTLGSIVIAAATTVRSYKLMMGGIIVQSFGDIATQVAQYKIFSSWFAPSNGFASTLGFELGIGKIGSFIGQATANPISKGTGDFSWVYWTAVFMNLFTNLATVVFWLFRRYTDKHYGTLTDPATGEVLRENAKKWEFKKFVQIPWPFWCVILFTASQTSTSIVFSSNATELAEQRFHVSSVKAGWYTATSQYMGFFLVPLLGIFLDVVGHRLTVLFVCAIGTFLAMCLAAFGPNIAGTAASLGVYAFAVSLGATTIIDAIRTIIWYQDTFGAAYAVKILVNNCMNIMVRVVTGVIQDKDDNSYNHVTIVYAILASGAVVVSMAMLAVSHWKVDLRRLQWTRKQRQRKGEAINELRDSYKSGPNSARHKLFSKCAFASLGLLVLGGWTAYFWGVATGNNE